MWFALIYFAFNIPLLLGFGFKTKKSFIFFVSLFLVFQAITYAIFSIPSVENWIYHTFNVAPGWNKYLYLQDPMTHALTKIENPVTWPILVNAAIGSTLIGIAIALTWKCGGSTGGTDIIVYYLATKVKKNLAFIMTIVSFVSAIVFLIIFGFAAPHSATYTNIQNVLDIKKLAPHSFILVKPVSSVVGKFTTQYVEK